MYHKRKEEIRQSTFGIFIGGKVLPIGGGKAIGTDDGMIAEIAAPMMIPTEGSA